MRVAIDIDGVLNYIEKYQLEHGIPWFRARGYEVVNPKGFDVTDIFECSDEIRKEFWKTPVKGRLPIVGALIFDLAQNAEMRPGVPELLKQLDQNGDIAYIVTERYATGRKGAFGRYNRNLVYKWLKKNGVTIPKERILFVPDGKKKEDLYRENDIDVILEDKVENIRAIEKNEGLYAVVFNAGYNETYHHEKAFRVDLPTEVFPVIKKIEDIKASVARQSMAVRNGQFQPKTGIPSKDQVWRQYYTESEDHIDIPQMTMMDFLRKKSEKWPDAVILVDDFGHKYTYSGFLNSLVPQYARAFVNCGVTAGEPVVIALPNVIAVQAAKFALNTIGAIPVMVNPLSSKEEFVKYLTIEKDGKTPRVLMMFNRSVSTVGDALKEINRDLEHVINVGVNSDFHFPYNLGYKLIEGKNDPKKTDYSEIKNIISLKQFLSGSKNVKKYDEAPFRPNSTAVIYFTGGTTGFEKAVEITNENAIAIAMQFTILVKTAGVNDVTMNAMPWFHVFGDNQIFYFASCNGMTNYVVPKFNRREVDKLFKRDMVNYNGVPAFLHATLANLSDPTRLKSIKKMISGGAALPYATQTALNKALKRSGSRAVVEVGYGITEGAGGVSFTLVGADEAGCIGIPTPGTNMKIVNPETGEELGYDRDGEICFSGPSVMKGYLNNPDENARCLKIDGDGAVWFHSGDMGKVKENGLFYFSDRIKRMIIVSGENVYPNRVEKVVIDNFSDSVADCFVISKPDELKGEVPVAKISLKPGIEPGVGLKSDILGKIKSTFKNKKYWPVELDFISSVPMTKMSKADYKRLDDPSLIIRLDEPEKKPEKVDRLKDNYCGNRFYKVFHALYSPFYKSSLFGRKITVIGREYLPEKGAGIIAMNHLNAQDQNAILANVDRIVSLPSKQEYFEKRLSRYFMNKMEMIPVDRFGDANYSVAWIKGIVNTVSLEDYERDYEKVQEIIRFVDSLDVRALKQSKNIVETVKSYIETNQKNDVGQEVLIRMAQMPVSGEENGYGRALQAGKKIEKLLKAGRLIGAFPEGTRNIDFAETGQLLPFHDGVVYWAMDTYSPIIPVAITGEHKRGGELLVRIGKPIRIDGSLSESEVKTAIANLRNRIYEMVLYNLAEQDTTFNQKALKKAIEHLSNSEDVEDKKILERLNSRMNKENK